MRVSPSVLVRLALVCGIPVAPAAGVAQAAPASQAGTAAVPAADAPRAARDHARAIIADARRIASANGVEELLDIPVGGTRQWISVRGRDRSNPILLMIHGGPASPEMPTSWAFQDGWEDYFTVVQWDQRGSGKSYNANDPAVVGPTLSLERITEDAAEVVQYLRHRYGKDRVFVLGHSWGSLVGLELARRHPELLHAYIGMGQVVSGRENERVSYARTLRAAEAAGNATAIRELKAIAPYPESDGGIPLRKVIVERKWSDTFGGLVHGRDDIAHYLQLAELSPEYTDADVAAIDLGSRLSLPRLLPEIETFDVRHVTELRCPIIVFAGRHDTTTPAEPTVEWLERVRAPRKQLIWFEHSAHMMMVEEPGRVLVHLVRDALPLANAAGEVPRRADR